MTVIDSCIKTSSPTTTVTGGSGSIGKYKRTGRYSKSSHIIHSPSYFVTVIVLLLLGLVSTIRTASAMTMSLSTTSTSTCTKPSNGPVGQMKNSDLFISNYQQGSSTVQQAPLKQITITNNDSIVESDKTITLPELLVTSNEQQQQESNHVTIVYLIRRPGCILCREHGQQLTQFVTDLSTSSSSDSSSNNDNIDNNNNNTPISIKMLGIIKEINVDNIGLAEFYNTYFTYPLYYDTTMAYYIAFGNRKISLTTWNPIKLYNGYKELSKRLSSKSNLFGNYKGEGMIQGGILLFNSIGQLQYAYEEEIGSELNLTILRTAVLDIISKSKTTTTTTPTTTTDTTSTAATEGTVTVSSEL